MSLLFCILFSVFYFFEVSAQSKTSSEIDLQYEGTYELEKGHRITLGVFDEFKS